PRRASAGLGDPVDAESRASLVDFLPLAGQGRIEARVLGVRVHDTLGLPRLRDRLGHLLTGGPRVGVSDRQGIKPARDGLSRRVVAHLRATVAFPEDDLEPVGAPPLVTPVEGFTTPGVAVVPPWYA